MKLTRWLPALASLICALCCAPRVQADYFAPNNLVPSPVYRSTDTQTYNTPSTLVTESFFDIFVELPDQIPPPPPGTFVDSFFDITYRIELNGMQFGGSGLMRLGLNGLPPGVPWDHEIQIEMLQMELTGLPPGVALRESPTRPSLGRMSIDHLGSGIYQVDSFFDIFTELSLDGGQAWTPGGERNGETHMLGSIPEPSTFGILAAGAVALGWWGLRRQRSSRQGCQ